MKTVSHLLLSQWDLYRILWGWKKSFGLTNAPATFQQLMETCLGELHLQWCIICLDDDIIFSKTHKEQITRLRAVFVKLAEAGLKLKPSKCEFFKRWIAYLRHIVSKDGIETNPKKSRPLWTGLEQQLWLMYAVF